ncbi:hypothetical protein RRG08_031699 [Elysia crispata]|uniref:Uncharacterized protein n=1 Tax=Elysia crispata TaxID=231223 RepID=A0AAE0ZEX1_9GAST|nr:hypothetical protein RRG08_031699 [Elysia crispata]
MEQPLPPLSSHPCTDSHPKKVISFVMKLTLAGVAQLRVKPYTLKPEETSPVDLTATLPADFILDTL